LALATGTFIPKGPWRRAADILAAAFGACSAVVLAWGGWQMAAVEREAGTTIGAGIPTWIAQIVLPISFAIIALRLVWRGGAPPRAEASQRSHGERRRACHAEARERQHGERRRMARSLSRFARHPRRTRLHPCASARRSIAALDRLHRHRRGGNRRHAALRDP